MKTYRGWAGGKYFVSLSTSLGTSVLASKGDGLKVSLMKAKPMFTGIGIIQYEVKFRDVKPEPTIGASGEYIGGPAVDFEANANHRERREEKAR